MQAPVLPEHEHRRLTDTRALRILDTPPEERFDRIVRIVRQVFDVPMAYISVVDADRQWLKAREGLDVDETPREISFCGHTILQDEPLVVADTHEDPRFHDNPLVTGEPYIRFYAGHPLRGEHGENVATLCISDREPRSFSEGDRALLAEFAAVAENELNMVDLVQAQRGLIEAQQRLEHELQEAERYVLDRLPKPIRDPACPVRIDYRFISSSKLGGDLIGWHRFDDDSLSIYLLDVTGHGVGAALLSTTVSNALSPHGELAADLTDPGDVLTTLNRAFPMQQNAGKFFTIWYGVLDLATSRLKFTTGGHHPAVLLGPDGERTCLGSPNLMIGVLEDTVYETEEAELPAGSRLYQFSDGAFEVRDPDNGALGIEGLIDILGREADAPDRLDRVLAAIRDHQQKQAFDDDFSLIEVEVGANEKG